MPDAHMLWRHQIVESDIHHIQHHRSPDALTSKRRAHYNQQEAARFEEYAREHGGSPMSLADWTQAFPTGTFNRRSSELHPLQNPSETSKIHPGAWDKCFHEHRDLRGQAGKHAQFHGRKKLGAIRPNID